MMTLISAVTTSVIINVTTNVIATATPVESSSSDSSSTVTVVKIDFKVNYVCTVTSYSMYISHGVHNILKDMNCLN